MTVSVGTEAIKALSKARDASYARAKAARARQAEWVLDGELTAAELVAERDRLRAECMARNPSWFGVAA